MPVRSKPWAMCGGAHVSAWVDLCVAACVGVDVGACMYVGVNGGYWRVTYFWDPKVSCFHLTPQRQTNRLWTLLSQRAEEADAILVYSPCLFTGKHHLDVPKFKYTAWCFLLRFTMEDCTTQYDKIMILPTIPSIAFPSSSNSKRSVWSSCSISMRKPSMDSRWASFSDCSSAECFCCKWFSRA